MPGAPQFFSCEIENILQVVDGEHKSPAVEWDLECRFFWSNLVSFPAVAGFAGRLPVQIHVHGDDPHGRHGAGGD